MNNKEIRELIQMIEESSAIEEFEMERAGVRIRIRKTQSTSVTSSESEDPAKPAPTDSTISPEPTVEEVETGFIFEAPIVGTFYITPKPDAEPFVKIGDPVGTGTVLCIIEAMKIFNQIESDVDGKIVRVLAENGQPVEYGQPLFEIQVNA